MLKLTLIALFVGAASAMPLAPGVGVPGTSITHHTTTAHHGIPVGLGYGAYGFGYPGAVVKHTEAVSTGYPGLGMGHYGYPGISGLGYGGYGAGAYGAYGAYGGFPAAKQITQVTSTAYKPGMYGFY